MRIFEKSIDIAKGITDIFSKHMSFYEISIILGSAGKFDRAIEIELKEMLPWDRLTFSAITGTSKRLSKAGKFDQARCHANQINDVSVKKNALDFIEIVEMCKENKFNAAVELANTYDKGLVAQSPLHKI